MTDTGSAPAPTGRRARLVVAYDGGGFHGFADNAGVPTVMGTLSAAVAQITRADVHLTGAGRTDAGVHAWGQVVTGDLPASTDLADLARRVNKLCGPAIAVREASWAPADFDARFSATWRQYRYHVWNAPSPNPLEARTSWHVHKPLELWAMNAAGDPLVGEHDFTSFCRKPKVDVGDVAPSMVRRVLALGWTRVDDSPMLRFEIRATAFCHQMVRSIVGTMVEVGLGRSTPADVTAILRAHDRSTAPTVAPPHGLVLWEVGYDGERWDARGPEAAVGM